MDPAQTQLLASLRDIHLPAPVSWWPLAPGWWLLAVLLLLMMVWTLRRLIKRWQLAQLSRQAQALLDQAYQSCLDQAPTQQYLSQANKILKRVLISLGHTSTHASLHGNQWAQLLEQSFAHQLNAATIKNLSFDVYKPHCEADINLVHLQLSAAIAARRLSQLQRSNNKLGVNRD